MDIEYLFQPDQVIKVLENYQFIKEKIKNPFKEGKPSISFPLMRKTGREIYRIFCNQHYPHLQDLLSNLDLCLQSGWEQPTLIQTRSGRNFDSAVSELKVATHFVKAGFKVSSFDQRKGQDTVPDILIKKDNMQCLCEVYSPRDWDGLYYFVDDIRLSLLHLDISLDFDFRIKMDLSNYFDEGGKLLNFDPRKFSGSYVDSAPRSKRIGPLIDKISKKLQEPDAKRFTKRLIDKSNNIITMITFHQIKPSQYKTPAREGVFSFPMLTGYSPECMFESLVKRRIHAKIKKRQTDNIEGDYLKALFVDVSKLGYKTEFDHPYYVRRFAESIIRNFNSQATESDLVIFFLPINSNLKDLETRLIFKMNTVTNEMLKLLFGDDWNAIGLTDEVFVDKRFSKL